jgi:alanine racemase
MSSPDGSAPTGLDQDRPWLSIEVDTALLAENIAVFRRLVNPATQLLAVVKANAYGHGLLLAARAFLQGGADILGVHSLSEARRLRDGGLEARIIVLGPVTGSEAVEASRLGVEVTLGSAAAVLAVSRVNASLQTNLKVHLKVETGVNRQGLLEEELAAALGILSSSSNVQPVGMSSHFADIEDTTDHGFARRQMERFSDFARIWKDGGFSSPEVHMSCSAAVLLFDSTHGGIARVGVSAYGIWPSRETRVAARQLNRPEIVLKPAVTWKVRVAQVRSVPAGETVGYGRSWKAMTDTRVAVLPVGYSDGVPRALSGRGHVLLGGKRAPLIGRICMNLCMVDVTHIPGVVAGDEAVLLGRQGTEEITAEMLADHLGTIAYEVLTLPGESWTRISI